MEWSSGGSGEEGGKVQQQQHPPNLNPLPALDSLTQTPMEPAQVQVAQHGLTLRARRPLHRKLGLTLTMLFM